MWKDTAVYVYSVDEYTYTYTTHTLQLNPSISSNPF